MPKRSRYLSVRIFPLLAVLALAATAGLFVLASGDPVPRLGRPTVYSVGFFFLMWVFTVMALLGLIQVGRARQWEIRRGVWWHALLLSVANALVVLYLAYWGLIGLRPWAY